MPAPTPWNNEHLVNTQTTGDQQGPVVTALANGGYVVVWTDKNGGLGDNSGSAVKAQFYNANGSKHGGEFLVNKGATTGDQFAPEVIASEDGGFTVAWKSLVNTTGDIRGRTFSAEGVALGSEFNIGPTMVAATGGGYPHLAMARLPDGKIVVTWTVHMSGSNADIFAQVISSNGTPSGPLIQYTNPNVDAKNSSVFAFEDGYYMLGWTDNGKNGGDIRAQVHTVGGAKVGAEFTVNQVTTGAQGNVNLEKLSDGRFLATWESNTAGVLAVKGQFFTAGGSKSGAEFLVAEANQSPSHDVAALPDGGFVVSWNSNGDVVAQRFAADGTAVGETFTVNQTTPGLQASPSVTTLPDGRIVFAFTDNSQSAGDLDGLAVRARIFEPRDEGIAFFGTGLDDQRVGSEFVDILSGGKGNDVFYGGGGNDSLTGGEGNDRLYGGAGDDKLTGGAGADWLNGGAGIDTAYYTGSPGGVTVNLVTGKGKGGDAEGDTLISIENVVGGNSQDIMTGNTADNVLEGRGGDDTLHGGKGNDILIGGKGADTLDGGEGNDTASYAGSIGGVSVSLITGKGMFADAQDDTLISIENLIGSDYADVLIGNDEDNVLAGGKGADTMIGRKGNDTYYVDNVGDKVVENPGEGIDHVIASVSYSLQGQYAENLTLTGAANLDATGNSLDNVITGNDGNNVINGHAGVDTMIGGKGNDTYHVDFAGDKVVENANEGYDIVRSTVSYKLASGVHVEELRFDSASATFALDLTGNAFDQKIVGNAGANRLDGGGGVNALYGLGGDDTYIVRHATDKVVEKAGEGTDVVYATVSYKLASGVHVEELRAHNTAGTGAIDLTGNAFDQKIVGSAGANKLDGGGGVNTMYGYGGDDVYIVRNAADKVAEKANEGYDIVRATVSYKLASGTHVEELRANSSADTGALDLTGNAFDQKIVGSAGANKLDGGGGVNVMHGLDGDDVYIVRNAADKVVEKANEGYDIVRSTVSYKLASGVHVEELRFNSASATDALDLTGNAFDQKIVGNAGNNRLDGGGGQNTLTGGAGQDVFVFSTAIGPVDKITDFIAVDDTIELSSSIFTGLAKGQLNASAFKNIAIGTVDADDRILYDSASGALFFDQDGSGGTHQPVQFAILTNKAAISAADFFVV